MTAYFISGLGADRRIFSRLRLPEGLGVRHIEWLEPLDHESMEAYCIRLSAQIDQKEDFILVGLSFGGMVAMELNKLLHPKVVILISSVATRQEMPVYFRLMGRMKLNRLAPASLLKFPTRFILWFFNVRTEKEKQMLYDFIHSISDRYLKWSINQVLNWKNNERPENVFHIHGANDRIFPFKKTHADACIPRGGHLMVYDQAREISRLINERVKELRIEN